MVMVAVCIVFAVVAFILATVAIGKVVGLAAKVSRLEEAAVGQVMEDNGPLHAIHADRIVSTAARIRQEVGVSPEEALRQAKKLWHGDS